MALWPQSAQAHAHAMSPAAAVILGIAAMVLTSIVYVLIGPA